MLAAARVGTNDLEKAAAFYDAIAKTVGASRAMERPGLVGYKSPENGEGRAMLLVGAPLEGKASVGNGAQVGVAAPSRAAVDQAHAKALELGGKCEGPPGIRGDDPNGFYGAYFRDLDGNKLVVFRMGPPDA